MTAIPTRASDRLLPAPGASTHSVGYWAMGALCATEASLFAMLLASYFYLAVGTTQWPPAGIDKPKLLLPAIMTGVLLASSVAMWWAEHSIARGRPTALRLGLVLAATLGVVFLALQGMEYREKLHHFVPADGAYPSIFYTITGFHGMHVTAGVLLMLYGIVRAFAGHFDAHRHLAVKNIALYWHFVDAVWLAIFSCLYLSPHLT